MGRHGYSEWSGQYEVLTSEVCRFVRVDGTEVVVTSEMLDKLDKYPRLAAFMAFVSDLNEAEELVTPHYTWGTTA